MFDWESQLLGGIRVTLGSFQPKQGIQDKWIWKGTPEGLFTVKSAYELQLMPNTQANKDVFLKIWTIAAPSNIQAFIWRIIHDRIQTKTNLKKRNVVHPGLDFQCVLCSERGRFVSPFVLLQVFLEGVDEVLSWAWNQHCVGLETCCSSTAE